MLVEDKNFASINVWSTGNEAGEGSVHQDIADIPPAEDGNAAGTSDGGDVIQWSWTGGDNQRWNVNNP